MSLFICPDCKAECRTPEPSSEGGWSTPDSCECGYRFEIRDGILSCLRSNLHEDPVFRAYSANYDQIAEDDLTESIMNERYSAIQAEKLFGYLGSVSGLDVADLGIGRGLLFAHLLDASPKGLTGIDIAAEYLERFRDSKARVVVAEAENLPFENEFDLLVCSDILEHVLNLGDSLLGINRALRKDGRFVVRVPYREDLTIYSQLRGCPYRFVHLRSFNKALLEDALSNTGFEIRRIHYDGYYDERRRSWLRRPSPLSLGLDYLVRKLGPHEVTRLPNGLARLLMRPLEIVAVAQKVRDVA